MGDFILILHSYNVYLVILSGAITGIWGLIIFFRTKSINPDISKPAIKDPVAVSESKTDAPATNEVVPDSASAEASLGHAQNRGARF